MSATTKAPRFAIGIDLGTTHSALAWVDIAGSDGEATVHGTLPIPQLTAPGAVESMPLLPSFLYLPGPNDLPAGATALPWDKAAVDVVGAFARGHGAKIPGRLVSSAKSWLSHAGIDRTAPWPKFQHDLRNTGNAGTPLTELVCP